MNFQQSYPSATKRGRHWADLLGQAVPGPRAHRDALAHRTAEQVAQPQPVVPGECVPHRTLQPVVLAAAGDGQGLQHELAEVDADEASRNRLERGPLVAAVALAQPDHAAVELKLDEDLGQRVETAPTSPSAPAMGSLCSGRSSEGWLIASGRAGTRTSVKREAADGGCRAHRPKLRANKEQRVARVDGDVLAGGARGVVTQEEHHDAADVEGVDRVG